MSTATNKAIVRRYIEQVLNNQQLDLIDEFLAETVEFHGPTGSLIGLTKVAEWSTMFAAAFPDWHSTIDEMVAEGDKVVVRMTSKGTHQGEMEGIPATGKTVNMVGVTIFRLDNGKIAEDWLVNDNLSLMQQLGVIPTLQEY